MGSDGFKNQDTGATSPTSSGPSEGQLSQEQKALKLAAQGELQQAKIIYQDIIFKGTNDYQIYNN